MSRFPIGGLVAVRTSAPPRSKASPGMESKPLTPAQAMAIAQDFPDVVHPGTQADEIVAYYGYYTIMTKLEGEHYGMLGVNGYSGDVWYHTWHGMFISEVEEHE